MGKKFHGESTKPGKMWSERSPKEGGRIHNFARKGHDGPHHSICKG